MKIDLCITQMVHEALTHHGYGIVYYKDAIFYWRVFDGKWAMVQIYFFWTQKWVPYPEDFYIRTSRGPFVSSTRVSDFIKDGCWDVPKLKAHLSDHEAVFVSEIPISSTNISDRIIWHYESKGNYTVKSGYRLATKWLNQSAHETTSSSSFPRYEFWKQVWNIEVMPKIKTFWWRVCSNALATRENLFKRNCSTSSLCQICNSQVETVEHLLFECPWTKPVWFGSNYGLRVEAYSGTSSYSNTLSLALLK